MADAGLGLQAVTLIVLFAAYPALALAYVVRLALIVVPRAHDDRRFSCSARRSAPPGAPPRPGQRAHARLTDGSGRGRTRVIQRDDRYTVAYTKLDGAGVPALLPDSGCAVRSRTRRIRRATGAPRGRVRRFKRVHGLLVRPPDSRRLTENQGHRNGTTTRQSRRWSRAARCRPGSMVGDHDGAGRGWRRHASGHRTRPSAGAPRSAIPILE